MCSSDLPNGAGKTTLVKLLLGLLDPTAGRLKRRSDLSVGYVPQRFEIERAIPITVSRFLDLGARVDAAERTRALQDVGAERIAGQQLSDLSGGELQRVLLARALQRNPNLLVLDELGLAIELGYLSANEVTATLVQRPAHLDVIVTGTAMPPALMALADQVTHLRR